MNALHYLPNKIISDENRDIQYGNIINNNKHTEIITPIVTNVQVDTGVSRSTI